MATVILTITTGFSVYIFLINVLFQVLFEGLILTGE
jgi:preprotein translocase subunit SecE